MRVLYVVIGGVSYAVVNVLLLLMSLAGPTPVAGTNGTTAAMVTAGSHAAAVGRAR